MGAYPPGWGHFLPQGHDSRIYVKLHIPNIESLDLVVSEKIFFHVFPIISLWQIMMPGDGDPRGMVCSGELKSKVL